jgi:parallel beta-helix repeat protein
MPTRVPRALPASGVSLLFHRLTPVRLRRFKPLAIVLLVIISLALVQLMTSVKAWSSKPEAPRAEQKMVSRSSMSISKASASISLNNGHDLMVSYSGSRDLAQILEQNQAQPLAMATADFDEDGVPDLISGYTGAGRGILALYRGNVDSIYPESPEAEQRRASGTFSASPFLSTARVFETTGAPDFLGAGDFDADGHLDVLSAGRATNQLYFMAGDGRGNFTQARAIELAGSVTALATGEINRADGLTDVAVAIASETGAQLLVFEGPLGALRAGVEAFPLPAQATSLALGQLDSGFEMDLAIAAGHDLVVVHGRDRRLTLSAEKQMEVAPAILEQRHFAASLSSLAIGDFSGDQHPDIALLTEDGTIEVLSRVQVSGNKRQAQRNLASWHGERLNAGHWPQALQLVSVRVSGLPGDDLLVLDANNRQLHLLTEGRALLGDMPAEAMTDTGLSRSDSLSMSVESAPLAVLPMRLDIDALTDLVVIRSDQSAPTVALTYHHGGLPAISSQSSLSSSAKKQELNNGPVGTPRMEGAKAPDQSSRTPSPQKSRSGSKLDAATIERFKAGCAGTPINIGATVNGSLSTSDCFFDDGGDKTYVDVYTFNGTANQQISIAMSSSSFDTYLGLLGPGGSSISFDDDGGGGTNSYIPTSGGFFTLPSSGAYTIYAYSFGANETGNYTLNLAAANSGGCPVFHLNGSQSVNGSLTSGDCYFLPGTRGGSYLDTFTFSGIAGQQIVITMNSGDIDAFLYLRAPGGAYIDEDDDANGGTNARIPTEGGFFTLPSTGIFTIYATSFDPSDFGSYTLGLTFAAGSTVVTNTDDSGVGSLRNAIFNANANPGPDTITFNIQSGGTVKTIALATPLPAITGVVTINGRSQPGYSGLPIIELDGFGATEGDGLKLTGGSSVVRGLIVNTFKGTGISLSINGGNIIEGNYIGTNAAGNNITDYGNYQFGIDVNSSVNNTIGGTVAEARNLISGNGFSGDSGFSGIRITNNTTGNQVRGNYIGTDASGTVDLGNKFNGIYLAWGRNNTVAGNLVSGNGTPGICLARTGPEGNLVQGNFVGTNAAGTAPLGNDNAGIIIGGFQLGGDCPGCPLTANNNTVGGTSPAARNLVSGNNGTGIMIINLGSFGNLVQGNYVGTNNAGNAKLANTGSGLIIVGSNTTTTGDISNTIGGDLAAAGNVISGNAQFGIGIGLVNGAASGGNKVLIKNNWIGTDTSGNLNLGNGNSGIYVDAGSIDCTIAANTIAFNGNGGIYIPNNGSNPGIRINLDGNFIYSNVGLGIDLGTTGDTPNDNLDADGGANEQQNYPVLTSANGTASLVSENTEQLLAQPNSVITIQGDMPSTPNTTLVIKFTYGQGCGPDKEFTSKPVPLGLKIVTTNGSGIAAFTHQATVPGSILAGSAVLAEATNPTKSTSEHSKCIAISGGGSLAGTVQFSQASYSFSEGAGSATINVTRTGDASQAATVNYKTNDTAGLNACTIFNGQASERCDYSTTLGTLRWDAGDASTKSFTIPIIDDRHNEGNETLSVVLSDANGGANLGTTTTASVILTDNGNEGTANPIDNVQFFVTQQYSDFLGRLPDGTGLTNWVNTLNNCPTGIYGNVLNSTCDRIHVAKSTFQSAEFQSRGYWAYRFYEVAFGRRPNYAEFIPDMAIIGGQKSPAEEALSKDQYMADFVLRQEFANKYTATGANPTAYVDLLLQTAGLPSHPLRATLIAQLQSSQKSRAQVLRDIVESKEVEDRFYVRGFVSMMYYGFLRRDPDTTGFNNYVNQLNLTWDPRKVTFDFIYADEYRGRFGAQ